eukprot:scaffold97218_cov66-Phaeocystis_antarctica.AAC.2
MPAALEEHGAVARSTSPINQRGRLGGKLGTTAQGGIKKQQSQIMSFVPGGRTGGVFKDRKYNTPITST